MTQQTDLTPDEQRLKEIAELRLNIGDRPQLETDRLFSDEDLNVFLTREDGDVNRATARALRVIAGNMAMVLKVIERDELRTDGAAVSAELRQLADSFDEMSAQPHTILRSEEDIARQQANEREERWQRYRERRLNRRYGGYYP